MTATTAREIDALAPEQMKEIDLGRGLFALVPEVEVIRGWAESGILLSYRRQIAARISAILQALPDPDAVEDAPASRMDGIPHVDVDESASFGETSRDIGGVSIPHSFIVQGAYDQASRDPTIAESLRGIRQTLLDYLGILGVSDGEQDAEEEVTIRPHNAQLALLAEENARLSAEKVELERRLATLAAEAQREREAASARASGDRTQLAEAEIERERYEERIERLTASNEVLSARIWHMEAATTELARLQDEARVREAALTAQLADAGARAAEQEREIQTLAGENERLRERIRDLEAASREAKPDPHHPEANGGAKGGREVRERVQHGSTEFALPHIGDMRLPTTAYASRVDWKTLEPRHLEKLIEVVKEFATFFEDILELGKRVSEGAAFGDILERIFSTDHYPELPIEQRWHSALEARGIKIEKGPRELLRSYIQEAPFRFLIEFEEHRSDFVNLKTYFKMLGSALEEVVPQNDRGKMKEAPGNDRNFIRFTGVPVFKEKAEEVEA